MKRFFAERPMVAWFIVAVAATVISAWIINPPKEWPLTWLIQAAGSVDQLTLKVLAAAAILCVVRAETSRARIASDADEPTHGVYGTAGRRQDASSARAWGNLSIA